MPHRVVIGTANPDKLRELKLLMKGARLRALSLKDFPKAPDVVENGKTFTANAEKKARQYSLHTQSLVLADDSGLMVDRLKGAPGVYSARYAGPGCSYRDNNAKLLRVLKGVTASKRRAKFVCVIAIYDNGRRVATVRGECRGRISFEEKGNHGFGYDPVFIPAGLSRTFAELGPTGKKRLSHRSRALRKAKARILAYLKSL